MARFRGQMRDLDVLEGGRLEHMHDGRGRPDDETVQQDRNR